MSLDMKRYTFFVTFDGKAPLKVVEEGRTMSEAKQILEGRYPGARYNAGRWILMTPAEGFGMLAVGLIVIAIGGTILYLAINKIQDNEIKAKEKEEREKIFR